MNYNKILFSIIFLILLVNPLSAQVRLDKTDSNGRGVIEGKVVDKSNYEPVIAANIIVLGLNQGAATDLDGNFSITGIPQGTYAIQISALGFTTDSRTDLFVSNVKPIDLTIELEPSAIQLSEVTIRPSLFKKETDAPVSTTIQSNEEIRRLPGGFEDVIRATALLPGVAQVNAGRNDLIVRGGAPSENLYLIDNVAIPNINHFGTQGTGGGPQSYVNLDFIEKTSFSTGGFGAKYGDRISSVLSIDLAEARKDRFGGKATISASQFGFDVEGPIWGDKGGAYFSARRSYLDFIFKAAGFSFVPEYWDFLLKTSYELSPKDKLSFFSISAIDEVKLFNDDADDKYGNSQVLAPSQYQNASGMTLQHYYGKGYINFTLSSVITNWDAEQNDSLLVPIFRNISTERELGFRTEIVHSPDKGKEYTFGLQLNSVSMEADLYLRPFQTDFGQTLQVNDLFEEQSFKVAGYGQYSRRFGFLTTTAGIRTDYFELTGDVVTAPRFSLSYPILAGTTLNTSIGRYYQTPSYLWLITNDSNKDLKYIGADQIVLGIDHNIRYDVRFTVEGYFKNYFNYPASTLRTYQVLSNAGGSFGGSEDEFATFGLDPLVSEGKGWSRGIEFSVQKKMAEHQHYGTASLTISETKFTALDGIERPSAFDQRMIFNIAWGFLFKRNVEVAGKFRMATGRPYTPYNSDGSRDLDNIYSERTDVLHSLDLRVDRFWSFENSTLITYLDIQNVYNNALPDVPRWNEREGKAEIREGIGILPSIGISLQF